MCIQKYKIVVFVADLDTMRQDSIDMCTKKVSAILLVRAFNIQDTWDSDHTVNSRSETEEKLAADGYRR
jgi:hypothetical protein